MKTRTRSKKHCDNRGYRLVRIVSEGGRDFSLRMIRKTPMSRGRTQIDRVRIAPDGEISKLPSKIKPSTNPIDRLLSF